MLLTKSIQSKVARKDGIRICIMRRPDGRDKYDVWMPALAPSNLLLDEYHKKKIAWSDFENKFKKEVVKKQDKYLRILAEIASKYDVTILCWEKKPLMCHRRLVAEECKKINPKLNVVLK